MEETKTKPLPEAILKQMPEHLDIAYDILHLIPIKLDTAKLKEQQDKLVKFKEERAQYGWSVPSKITEAIAMAQVILKNNQP
jgi:hypothetical protein